MTEDGKTDLSKKTLVVIDGKSVFYRGYYAMGHLSRSDGTPTGGVYGFAVIAMEIVKKLAPDKVVVAWDKAGTSITKRKAIYKDYKAGRRKPPEDFFAQIPMVRELIEALSWGFLECDDYEADDIIGTLAYQVKNLNAPTDELATALSESGSSRPYSRGSDPIARQQAPQCPESASTGSSFCAQPSKESLSTLPCWQMFIISSDLDMLQVVDENTKMYRLVRGFSQIEEIDVRAVEEKYGILKDQFLDLKALKGDASDNIPGVPGVGEKTAVKLLNEYRSLDGIYEHIDEIKGATQKKLIAGKESAYMSYKLGKIMTDAPVSLAEIPDLVIDADRIIGMLKALEFNSLIRKYHKLLDAARSSRCLSRGESDKSVATDLSALMLALPRSVPPSKDSVMTLPLELSLGMEIPKDLIICEDVKKEMHLRPEVAERVLGGEEYWDLVQGEFLLNPLLRWYEMKEVEAEYVRQREAFEKLPRLYRVYKKFDLPLIPVLYKMEKRGIMIDRKYFEELKAKYEEEVSEAEKKIYELAGEEFKINSPLQLSEVLYGKLGLSTKGVKKTKRGYSTGVKELERLKGEHEIIPALMRYREVAKLLSTYIAPMPELADEEGRIHTTFTQNVTATGRLSSVNPNLQNIPVRTEEGRKIREGFRAGPGKVLISADYAQFELRLAAVLSGDKELIADFNSGADIHTKTASEVFGVPMDEVKDAQRRAAKVINFGVLYGMSAQGLAQATGMSVGEAKQFIEDYFKVRSPIAEYLDKVLEQARTEGYVETYFGRRRPTPDVKSPSFMVRMGAERAARNMPIQGTEADLMKRAMILVDARLPEGAEMILQIHDSLVVECDESLAGEVAGLLKKTMEGVAPELSIKLAVDVTLGKNWGELHA